MDEKDLEILTAVARRGSGSPEIIAEETGIPKSTVHYRIKNLREAGIVKNDLFDLDLDRLGLGLTVITEVLAEFKPDYHRDIGEQLSDIEGINQVYFTMGETDFVVVAHLPDHTMVEELIESYEAIDGIERTNSEFVITTIKDEPNPLNDFDPETLAARLSLSEG